MTDEESKAVQEVAKTARKGLEIAERAGPFLERVLGPLVENAVGIVSDQLAYFRLTRFFSLVDKVKALLASRGIENTRSVPPSFALPLIQAATIEHHEEIHDLWANLLATAMDLNAPEMRRSYVGILQQFEPTDAKLMLWVYEIIMAETEASYVNVFSGGGVRARVSDLADQIGTTKEDVELSLFNIDRLGCVMVSIPGQLGDSYQPITTAEIKLTALGKALVEACY